MINTESQLGYLAIGMAYQYGDIQRLVALSESEEDCCEALAWAALKLEIAYSGRVIVMAAITSPIKFAM